VRLFVCGAVPADRSPRCALAATYDLAIPVMFSPTSKGTFTFHYVFRWKDRLGSHSLTVVLTGKGV